MPLRSAYYEAIKLLGFRSGGDLLASAFGVKLYSWPALKVYLTGTSLAAVLAFCTHWLWKPPSALFLLIFLDLVNYWYGWQVARDIKKESWKWDKARRTYGKIVATVILLGIVRNSINSYDYYELAADVIFGGLFVAKLQKVISKMVALRVSEEGLPALLMRAVKLLLNSKLAPFLVDNAQPPRESAEAPKPLDPPTDTPPPTTELNGNSN